MKDKEDITCSLPEDGTSADTNNHQEEGEKKPRQEQKQAGFVVHENGHHDATDSVTSQHQQDRQQQELQQAPPQPEESNNNSNTMVDITSLVETCATTLTYSEPFLCNSDCFSLNDAMAASQLMDRKMDCCELSVSVYRHPNNGSTPLDKGTNNDNSRTVAPRPTPSALRDDFTCLPWSNDDHDEYDDHDGLNLLSAAWIGVEMLIRFQSFLSGASVGESIFTCLYAHSAVLMDMKNQLSPLLNDHNDDDDDDEHQQVDQDQDDENDETATTSRALLLTEQLQNLTVRATSAVSKEPGAGVVGANDGSTDGGAAPSSTKTKLQYILFACSLALVEITDMVRGIILNADVYEEEDFVANTHNIPFFTEQQQQQQQQAHKQQQQKAATQQQGQRQHQQEEDHNNLDVLAILGRAMKFANELPEQESDAVRVIQTVLGFQCGFLSICATLARMDTQTLRTTVESTRSIVCLTVNKMETLLQILQQKDEGGSSSFGSTRQSPRVIAVLSRCFDSFVNRPAVGNAPVRRVSFCGAAQSMTTLKRITAELDWAVCQLLLHCNTLSRCFVVLDRVSRNDCNILTRSLIILNLYFDEKLLGQYSLRSVVVHHMRCLSYLPESLLVNEHAIAFLQRLAKPIYDTLKLYALNRNRQRAYLEAVMLQDWMSMQQEAHLVDVQYQREQQPASTSANETVAPPYFSQYVLYILIRLMDHHVTSGMEAGLFFGPTEISIAYWYRCFLLSALLNCLSMQRRTKQQQQQQRLQLQAEQQQTPSTAQQQHNAASNNSGKRGKKKKHQKQNANHHHHHNNHNNSSASLQQQQQQQQQQQHNQLVVRSQDDVEYDLEVNVLNLKRHLCRGMVRFIASCRQAGLFEDEQKDFDFTTAQHQFEKRFEVFSHIAQPPPLTYHDYVQGSTQQQSSLPELLSTTNQWFQSCKQQVDQIVLAQQQQQQQQHQQHNGGKHDSKKNNSSSNASSWCFAPLQPEETKALIKVCVGNSVYLHKLKQLLDEDRNDKGGSSNDKQAKSKGKQHSVEFDFSVHDQFCTIKVT